MAPVATAVVVTDASNFITSFEKTDSPESVFFRLTFAAGAGSPTFVVLFDRVLPTTSILCTKLVTYGGHGASLRGRWRSSQRIERQPTSRLRCIQKLDVVHGGPEAANSGRRERHLWSFEISQSEPGSAALMNLGVVARPGYIWRAPQQRLPVGRDDLQHWMVGGGLKRGDAAADQRHVA